MGNSKTKCHICKTMNKGKEQSGICSVCNADLLNLAAESILKKVGCAFLTGGQHGSFGESGWNGELFLTTKRLFFIKTAPIPIEAGRAFAPVGKDSFDLMPNNIKMFEIEESGKRGVNDKYRITTDEGETLRFSIPAKYFTEWKLTIEHFTAFA